MIGQITLLSPTGDGGFETGTTFAANGWTAVNAAASLWEVGTGAVQFAGNRGAYTINATSGVWSYLITTARTSHFYRDIAIPAGASSITLSFYWKGKGESNWDRALVYTAPTTVTPAVNVPLSNTTAIAGATLVWTQPNVQPDPPTYTLATVPLPNALAGTTVRIIFTWQNDASGGIAPGAAIDNIGLTYFAACAGLPNSGTAAITAASGCASANFTLSATGLTGGAGISYQWQSALAATGPWTNIAGATTATYTTSATVNTFYRIVTTCANGGASANSTAVSYTISGNNCTCGPYPLNFATSTADEDITNVTIGAMNNISACGALAPGAGSVAFRYGNYTGSVAGPSVVQGSSVPFSLTMTTCGGNFTNFFQIYVDWNQDGDFADAGEQVYSQAASVSGNQTAAGNFNVPLTALVGVTRMRIINIEAAASLTNYATTAYTYGETEDYCINVTAAAACSGTPSAGTSTISAASGCANTNFTLTGNGLTIGTGITYQWQSASTGAGPWSNIAGATSSTLNTTANTTTYFRLVTTCVNSGASSNTNSVSYTIVGDNCTCGPYPLNFATSAADEDITNVTIGGMNNSSVCGTLAPGLGSVASQYSNFTGSVSGPSVVQGSSVPFSLTMTTCGGNYSNFFQIYVDWNQDGDFADAGEQVYSQAASATGNQTVTGNFNVPGTALVGLTRMRIVNIEATASLTNYTNQNYTWGETEDYCITINAAAPCAGVPNAGTSTISINSGCPNTSFTLSASGLSFGIGTTYQWQSSGSALGPWSNIPAATSITLTTSATATTFYRILTTCSNGGTSNISNSVSYTINCNDIVCEAFTIGCGQTLTGTTTNATLSGTGEGTACTITPTQPGVWYKVIGDGQNMTASLCGTAWDSRIQVFSGADCNNLTCVGGNDNGGPACAGTSASFQWTSVVGVNYYILVSGAISNSTFNLSLTCETPPTNDLICNASSLTCGQTINGTTINASASGTGESQACGGFTQNQPGVWYSVVGSGQNINASLCASAWDSRIQVFTGSNCNSVTCIGGNDNDGPLCAGNAASFTWLAANATTYYILVSGVTNTSTFTLSVSCQTPCASACGAGAPPTNDACFGAQNLGAIPAPAACPNGVGAVVNFSGNNLCATAEANYTSLLGCTPAGNQASPAADVWYKFSITAPILNITLNGLTTPNIALYEGTNCLNLIPRGCAIGAAGLLTRQFQGLAPGTYYLQVSGGDVLDRCTFTISLQNNFDCSGCVLAADLNVTPAPINGQLQSNQLVTFCYTITSYQQTSANWLHGLVPSFGPGWDLSTFVPLGVTTTNGGGPNRCSSSGTWAYYPNSITSTANGSVFPPGFYFETSSGNAAGVVDGNPGNNFGDANPGNCSWTFCWQIRTKQLAQCVQDQGLNIGINTTGDGESGSWTSLACNLDPEVNFFSQSNCCPIPSLVTSNITCAGSNNGSATATGAGTSPWTYVWRNSAGVSILINDAVAGTSTINNLSAGDYSLQVTDATACTSYLNFTITEPVAPTLTINSNPSSVCNGASGTVIFNGPSSAFVRYNINNGPTQNITLGATGSFNLNTGNLSSATTYNLVDFTVGGCTYAANGSVTFSIQANNTISLPSSNPTLCINTTLTNITLSTTGANGISGAGLSGANGLPAGVVANWSANVITISGTPTASGTFNYSIPLTGGCGSVNATGTITVTAANTVGAASSSPTICINTPLTNITHTTTGASGISNAGVSGANGLPSGVSANWAANVITITGSPTVPGTFFYSIPLTGGCGSMNATGTITVTGINTVGVASSSPTLCINTTVANITHSTTGATGISNAGLSGANGLPAGITASWSANVITISGTPTAAGTFNYSIPLTGGCGTVNATGTITVTAANTVGAASSSPTICINTPLTNITHTTTGASGISNAGVSGANGLPSGVSAIWSADVLTISGTPTTAGTYNYNIPLTGGCGLVNAAGIITVIALPTVSANAVVFNSVCAGPTAAEAAIPSIILTLSPATASANWALYAGTTATGVPIQTGTGNPNYAFTNNTCSNQSFVYRVIPTLNGCNGVPLDISITVKPKPVSSFTISPNPVCIGQTATLTYTSPTCPSSSFNWESTLTPPNGYVANLATPGLNPSATNAATVTVTPSVVGTYTIRVQSTAQAGCTGPMSPSIALVVTPLNTVTASTPKTACQNQALSSTIQFTTTGATGISNAGVSGANGLPVGLSASWASNTITISGTPTASGIFNYSIPLTGGCGTVNATGTITVVAPPTATLISSTSICPGSSSTINFSGTSNASLSWSTSSGGAGTFVLNASGVANIGPTSINAAWVSWPAGTVITFSQVSLNGCTSALNVVVSVTSSLNVSVSAQSPICAGGTSQLTFTGTPSATVTYNIGGGNLITNTGASGSVTVSSPVINSNTNVTVTLVQIAGGCSQVLSNSAAIVILPSNTTAIPSSNPTLCINTVMTPITIATTGATGISNAGISGANGLPAGVSAIWSGNTITISGTPTAAGNYNYSIPLTGGCGLANATGTITVNALAPVTLGYGGPFCPAFNSVPPTNSWSNGGTYSVSPAGLSINTGTGLIALNTSASGTYTVTFVPNGCAASATTAVTISDILDYANLQFPANATICQTGSFDAYGQVYNDGLITTLPDEQAAGITVQIGYGATADPSGWSNWINATFNAQVGNNDEYKGTLSELAPGTYYYTFRYQINGCAWQYGGYNSSGGGFWNGTTNNSGLLTVTATNNAGNDGSVTVCATGTSVNLFSSLSGGAASTGIWSGPSTLGGGSQGNFNPLSNAAGIYTYTVSGGACPNDSSLVNVSISNSPTATVTYPSPVCTNISTAVVPVISGSTGGTFSALPAGISLAANGGFVPSATVPNTYNVTYNIAAASGCAAFTTTNTVVVNAPPTSPTLLPNAVCSGASATFTATGGTWYEYFLNGSSVGVASASNAWTSGTLNAGDVVCVRSFNAPPIMDGNLTDGSWTPFIPGTTGGPASVLPFTNNDSRLDGLKMVNRNGQLYFGIAGSEIDGTLPNENNRILIFIDSKPGGFNSLSSWVNRSNAGPFTFGLRNLDGGVIFDPGFEADYIISINRANSSGVTTYYDLYDMQLNTGTFLGSSPSAQFGYIESFTDNDLTKGFEFFLPLSAIGNPASLKVFGMMINDPGEFAATLISNQFFSVAGNGDLNYGNGNIIFEQANPNPISYQVSQDCFQETCVTVTTSVSPTFTNPPPICQGQPAPTLPSSSNGVSGTWSPPVVSNQNTATYTFTPTTVCGGSGSITVTVTPTPGTTVIFHE